MEVIKISIEKGQLAGDVLKLLPVALKAAILSEMGRNGGSKSTRAKRDAAFAREARKRALRAGGKG